MAAAEAAATLRLTRELIARRSITPKDNGCQDLLAARLKRLEFAVEPVQRGEVTNLWARRGRAAPLLCFVGHTDVVPTGPLDQRSEEHTSELQSLRHLVCRLLLEKK